MLRQAQQNGKLSTTQVRSVRPARPELVEGSPVEGLPKSFQQPVRDIGDER